jgi:hypothetical protein
MSSPVPAPSRTLSPTSSPHQFEDYVAPLRLYLSKYREAEVRSAAARAGRVGRGPLGRCYLAGTRRAAYVRVHSLPAATGRLTMSCSSAAV